MTKSTNKNKVLELRYCLHPIKALSKADRHMQDTANSLRSSICPHLYLDDWSTEHTRHHLVYISLLTWQRSSWTECAPHISLNIYAAPSILFFKMQLVTQKYHTKSLSEKSLLGIKWKWAPFTLWLSLFSITDCFLALNNHYCYWSSTVKTIHVGFFWVLSTPPCIYRSTSIWLLKYLKHNYPSLTKSITIISHNSLSSCSLTVPSCRSPNHPLAFARVIILYSTCL